MITCDVNFFVSYWQNQLQYFATEHEFNCSNMSMSSILDLQILLLFVFRHTKIHMWLWVKCSCLHHCFLSYFEFNTMRPSVSRSGVYRIITKQYSQDKIYLLSLCEILKVKNISKVLYLFYFCYFLTQHIQSHFSQFHFFQSNLIGEIFEHVWAS